MESNGIKDKIHVSEATAQLIIAAGKSHWITAREDQIEAKGMYFITKSHYFVHIRLTL